MKIGMLHKDSNPSNGIPSAQYADGSSMTTPQFDYRGRGGRVRYGRGGRGGRGG